MNLLESVKFRCGIPETISIYDEIELIPLINDAIDDMKTAGVPESFLPSSDWTESDIDELNARVMTCLVCYVQTYRGQDRTDSSKYQALYQAKLRKLMLETED